MENREILAVQTFDYIELREAREVCWNVVWSLHVINDIHAQCSAYTDYIIVSYFETS